MRTDHEKAGGSWEVGFKMPAGVFQLQVVEPSLKR